MIPGSDYFYCGKDRIDAAAKCGTANAFPCPTGLDSACPDEEFCLKKLFECAETTHYCGSSPESAAETCTLPCPNGDGDCSEGDTCYETLTACDQVYVAAQPPGESNGGSIPMGPNTNHCGSSWSDADSRCDVQCPMVRNTCNLLLGWVVLKCKTSLCTLFFRYRERTLSVL